MAKTVGYWGGMSAEEHKGNKWENIVICPDCLTAARESQFESSPDREGKPCWRCPGRYVLVMVPKSKKGRPPRETLLPADEGFR